MMAEIILWIVCGIAIGFCIGRSSVRRAGVLEIDLRDPEHKIYRLDVQCEMDDLPKRKYIKLEVDPHAELSQGKQSL